MIHDSNPPDAFENIDTIIAAIGEATTEEERRIFLRTAARAFELALGQMHSRAGALADALTPKESR